MFTGISECMGKITAIDPQQGVLNISIACAVSGELKVDQSVCHDGICLTIVELLQGGHRVQAISETVSKTNISGWEVGSMVNIERSLPVYGRFDGHIVQGHVDTTAVLDKMEESPGQLKLVFRHNPEKGITVEKGSICVNGISLTVVDSTRDGFSVALIPYTRENTNLGHLKTGDIVNIEFDIIGKYLARFREL